METEHLFQLTADKLAHRIANSRALGTFARRRAKFEGWLKVELIDILISEGYEAEPERGRVDITFKDKYASIDEIAIELKTINTNYRDGIAENLIRPITKNVSDLIQDIDNYRLGKKAATFIHKFIVFVVFPLSEMHDKWARHRKVIETKLGVEMKGRGIEFSNGIKGGLYYGKVVLSKDQEIGQLNANDNTYVV